MSVLDVLGEVHQNFVERNLLFIYREFNSVSGTVWVGHSMLKNELTILLLLCWPCPLVSWLWVGLRNKRFMSSLLPCTRFPWWLDSILEPCVLWFSIQILYESLVLRSLVLQCPGGLPYLLDLCSVKEKLVQVTRHILILKINLGLVYRSNQPVLSQTEFAFVLEYVLSVYKN